MLAAAFGIGVTADDAFLPRGDFDFQPLTGALLFVRTAALLGDDAFQAPLFRRFEQGKAALGIVIGKMNDATVFNQALQQLLSLVEGHAAEVEAVEVNEIECVVDDRHALASGKTALSRTESRALLHEAEGGASLFVESDNLSVEDGALGLHKSRQVAEFGKLRAEVVLVARDQAHAAVVDETPRHDNRPT